MVFYVCRYFLGQGWKISDFWKSVLCNEIVFQARNCKRRSKKVKLLNKKMFDSKINLKKKCSQCVILKFKSYKNRLPSLYYSKF